MKIFEIENPFWLADTFIFAEVEDCGYCYIKVNSRNEIEDIGVDIAKRMQCDNVDMIINSNRCSEASEKHSEMFQMIGKEYWFRMIDRKCPISHISY